MLVTFRKTYSNSIGRKFHRFTITNEDGTRARTFDIVIRRGRGEFETMSKADAKKRAMFLFSMGDEIESMTQQLVDRFRQYGEAEIKRCYVLSINSGLYDRWEKWLIAAHHQLVNEVGSKEWRLVEFIKQESALR